MEKWWSPSTVAVVTGANKGIGFHIARKLAGVGLTTIVAARNPVLGEEACKKLRDEGLHNVEFRQLDINDQGTIDSFSKWLEQKFGGLDILVNNAGFAYKGDVFGAKEARHTIDTNYRGTRAVCERLLPLLRASPAGARIVNVSSSAGKLRIVSSALQARLTDPELTEEQLDEVMEQFIHAVEKGDYKQKGFPSSMYGMSKLGESTYTRILARRLSQRAQNEKQGR